MKTRALFATTAEHTLVGELSLTALRIFFGIAMAFAHGRGKFPPSEQFVAGVTNLGFPAPEMFAWLAGTSEFIGGLFLALGFLTRPSAFLVAITMAVAAFGRHATDPFKVKELALVYLFVALIFAVRGAGKFSVDRFLSRG
jgi:putative oxidoreductase